MKRFCPPLKFRVKGDRFLSGTLASQSARPPREGNPLADLDSNHDSNHDIQLTVSGNSTTWKTSPEIDSYGNASDTNPDSEADQNLGLGKKSSSATLNKLLDDEDGQNLEPEVVEKDQADPKPLSDSTRMSPELLALRISQIAAEIVQQCDGTRKKADKTIKKDEVAKCIKRLSFHERCNRIAQLFSEHIKEESLENSTLYSCKTCALFPKTINRVFAERHARSHGFPKKRPREKSTLYECAFCDDKFNTKKSHIEHYQSEHCETGLRKITCTTPHHALYTRTVVHVLYHIGNIDQYTHSLAGEHTLHVVVHLGKHPGQTLNKN